MSEPTWADAAAHLRQIRRQALGMLTCRLRRHPLDYENMVRHDGRDYYACFCGRHVQIDGVMWTPQGPKKPVY